MYMQEANIVLKKLDPGDIFTFAGEHFVVLEQLEGETFVLTKDLIGYLPFQEKDTDTGNDYSKSTVKELIDKWVTELPRNRLEAAAIFPFELDLRPVDQSNGYGTIEVRAAPLTLWQYGKYKEIIPPLEDWWWLATPPWTRWLPSQSADICNYALYANTSGGWSYYSCSDLYGVRPALKLDSEAEVEIGVDDYINNDGCQGRLESYSTEELLDEIKKRIKP